MAELDDIGREEVWKASLFGWESAPGLDRQVAALDDLRDRVGLESETARAVREGRIVAAPAA
jgi:hypothetical protein